MKVSILIKSLPVVAILLVSFKIFMADGQYSWAKEFDHEINEIASHHALSREAVIPEDPRKIQLPLAKSLRVVIQKNLTKMNLMNYGREYGIQYNFKSINGSERMVCKARFAGDYLQGMVVEVSGIKNLQMDSIKRELNGSYPQYKILWVEL